jgi:hypothetical protein
LNLYPNLPEGSRDFPLYHAYHAYDPYLCEELNQTSFYYSCVTIYDKSKDGKASKDHVNQTFWYESESRNFHYTLMPLSTLFDGEYTSL